MRVIDTRVASLPRDRRDEFVAVVEDVFPAVGARLDTLAHYLVLCAFWGFIAYAAMQTFAALP